MTCLLCAEDVVHSGAHYYGSTQENEESTGTPRMVNETPTKHWTTIVVIPNKAVSAECRCGWVAESDEERPVSTQMEQASDAARRHREESIVT